MNVQAICHAFHALDYRDENARKPLLEMTAKRQRNEIAEYFRNAEGELNASKAHEITAALGDWLKPFEVLSAWRAADGTKLLQMVDEALARGLAKAIDKENEV